TMPLAAVPMPVSSFRLLGPPYATAPHAEAQRRALRGLADGGSLRRTRAQGALASEPPGPVGEPIRAQRSPCAGPRLRARAFGAFRDHPAIPARGCAARRPGRHRERRRRLRGAHAFGASRAFVRRGCLRGQRALAPPTRLGGARRAPARVRETKAFGHPSRALPRGLGAAPPLASLPPSPTSHRTAAPRPPTPSLF